MIIDSRHLASFRKSELGVNFIQIALEPQSLNQIVRRISFITCCHERLKCRRTGESFRLFIDDLL